MEVSEAKRTVEMTAEEWAEFQEMQAQKKAEQEAQARKSERETYKEMVDSELEATLGEVLSLSEQLYSFKSKVYENWHCILELKHKMFEQEKGEPMKRYSHTFTHSNGKLRLSLGYNLIDSYSDLAEDGVRMVKEYISSLASDDKSRMLVSSVLELLAKDQNGTLNAQRVLKLDKMAEESNDEKFKEGVRIIKEAYHPLLSKQYVRAWMKDEKNEWIPVPLSVTDAHEFEVSNAEKEEDET